MKNFFKTIFDIHSKIGKICTSICISVGVAALIGLPLGLTKCAKRDETVSTNYFLCEDVPLHSNNYTITVTDVYSTNSIIILNKDNSEEQKDGHYLAIDITIAQDIDSSLKTHKFDVNDFKIKDHTGVYLPLNDIMGAVGWDAIDVHIDSTDGGFVMSSTSFSTVSAEKDYHYINKTISAGESISFTLFFYPLKGLNPESDLIVLELDFYYTDVSYRQGSDIILLKRPENLK